MLSSHLGFYGIVLDLCGKISCPPIRDFGFELGLRQKNLLVFFFLYEIYNLHIKLIHMLVCFLVVLHDILISILA